MTKAFSPGNITCVFAIILSKDPLKKGSLGVSFAVNKGAIAVVKKAKKTTIIVNGVKKRFPTVETAIRLLTKDHLKVNIKTQLPIGCGYGMSGSCTLATVFAINKLLKLKNSKEQLALIAHKAEVINNTGLGTVTAEFLGGLLMRDKKARPLNAKRLKIDKNTIYCKSFGPLDTKKIITNNKMKEKINLYGIQSIKKIKKLKGLKLKDLVKVSKEFAEKTGLLKDKRVINLIKNIEKNNGAASMNMLGNSVFSNIPFKGCKVLKISNKGAYLIK